MPESVSCAISLMWACFYVGLADVVINISAVTYNKMNDFDRLSACYFIVNNVIFIVLVRVWRINIRYLLSLILIEEFLGFFCPPDWYFVLTSAKRGLGPAEWLLTTLACGLLFTRSASAWFRERTNVSRGSAE